MSGVQTTEQRIAELLKLRDRLDAELVRLMPTNPAVRRSRKVPPRCGTESGYQRHRYLGETCDDCKRAHADHERAAAIIRRSRKKVA